MSTKKGICSFLIGLFVIIFLVSIVVFSGTKTDLIMAKADVAQQRINAISIFNLNPNVDTSEVDEINGKRMLCATAMFSSVIGGIICTIILATDAKKELKLIKDKFSKQEVLAKTNNIEALDIVGRLNKLLELKDSGMISEVEYERKREEILKSL